MRSGLGSTPVQLLLFGIISIFCQRLVTCFQLVVVASVLRAWHGPRARLETTANAVLGSVMGQQASVWRVFPKAYGTLLAANQTVWLLVADSHATYGQSLVTAHGVSHEGRHLADTVCVETSKSVCESLRLPMLLSSETSTRIAHESNFPV